MTQRQNQAGLSLIELCIVIAIIAILLGQALPALQQMKQRQQLQAMAQTVMMDLQQARSEAVQQASAVQLRVSQHSQGSCYVLHSGAPDQCQCTDGGTPVCTGSAQIIKLEWLPAQRRLTIRANVTNMSFQARQGAVTRTGTIEITAANGDAIHHVVSIAGRVRSCASSASIGGLPVCKT